MKTSFGNIESKRLLFTAVCWLLISFLVVYSANAQQIHLNEVMSSNSSVISDEDGDFGDWIEIYNSDDAPISLEGYGLSDDYDSPFRWVFPDTTLDAGAFMLIWATNKDRSTPGRELHTNFAIAAAGEEVILTHPDGTRVDELEPTEIPRDMSIGRYPDGTGDWVLFDEPTPGQSNVDGSTIHLLEPPQFSHAAGFYYNDFMLEIAHPEEGVTIYYTLDGSDPTASSEVYTTPIHIRDRTSDPNQISTILTNDLDDFRRSVPPTAPIKKGTVVRTLSVKEGYSPYFSTQSYFVFPAGPSTHHLAVISITTDQKNLFDDEIGIYVPGNHYKDGVPHTGNYYQRGREWEREAGFEFFDENGDLQFSQNVGLRIHGGFSRRFTQKTLRVYARGEYGESRINYPIFPDLPYDSYNRLLLRNSGNDQAFSMLRDAVAHQIVSHFNMDTQAYRPAIVYINGEYWGLHNIRERYDRHYLERVYGIDPDNIDLLTGHWTIIEGSNQEYAALLTYIENQNLANDQRYEYVKSRMDVDNYLDYFSAKIFFANTDWPYNNIDFWRSRSGLNPHAPPGRDGRWRWLFYDLDFSFGLIAEPEFDMLDWVTREISYYENRRWPNLILRNLLENETFKTDFINRMADHLNTAFLPDRIASIITNMKSVIEPEMNDYGIRWRYPQNASVWNRTINSMIQWSNQRYWNHWQNIMDHFEIPSTETVTVTVSDETLAHIKVNSLDIIPDTPGISPNPYPWTGTYFSGIPITLHPEVETLYFFSHWVVDGIEVDTPVLTVYPEEVDHIELVIEAKTLDDIAPWKLADETYFISSWSSEVPAGTYPESMAFVYMSDPDPGLEADIEGFVNGHYDLDSGTRINGLGDDGFAFINSGNPEGSPGYPGTRLGGAILALDTRDVNKAVIEWTGGTVEPNSKVYHLRLQYRTDPNEPFTDFLDRDGNPVEYERNESAGHSAIIGPYPLPDDALNRERVEFLWRYYYTGLQIDEGDSERSKLNISSIYVLAVGSEPPVEPHHLSDSEYLFDFWPADSEIGTFPASMTFVYMDKMDPGLDSEPLGITSGIYSLDSRTRINGLGINGFAFINTSNQEGNPGYPGRRLGGAVLTLNLEGQGSAMTEWTGGTIDPGSRIYHLRLQFRLNPDEPFRDLVDNFGNPVEYRRVNEAGHSEKIGPVLLPPETDDQPWVQLLWRYYYTGVRESEESGQRSQLNISEIRVWSQPLLGTDPGKPTEFRLFQNYPNPFYPTSTIRYDIPVDQHVRIDLYTITGQFVRTLVNRPVSAGRHSVILDATPLSSGIYIYRLISEDFSDTVKMSVVK